MSMAVVIWTVAPAALDQAHAQEPVPVRFAEFVDRDDVRVMKLGRGFCLLTEPLHGLEQDAAEWVHGHEKQGGTVSRS